ncbi:hypothetical protein JW926_15515 [Candidatus Sumerlaeota bacterium]|nr:hypothetical protein [Candidatus Sumerlaeota bacterium]
MKKKGKGGEMTSSLREKAPRGFYPLVKTTESPEIVLPEDQERCCIPKIHL